MSIVRSHKRYFDIVEGTDGRFRISLAEHYARKFVKAIGGVFEGPAFRNPDEAERVGWTYISDCRSMKEIRRRPCDLAIERSVLASAQTSLF